MALPPNNPKTDIGPARIFVERPARPDHDVFPELRIEHEALRLLDLINAEFQSDPMSVQCFDTRIVARVKQCVEDRKRCERKGLVPPLLTKGRAT